MTAVGAMFGSILCEEFPENDTAGPSVTFSAALGRVSLTSDNTLASPPCYSVLDDDDVDSSKIIKTTSIRTTTDPISGGGIVVGVTTEMNREIGDTAVEFTLLVSLFTCKHYFELLRPIKSYHIA